MKPGARSQALCSTARGGGRQGPHEARARAVRWRQRCPHDHPRRAEPEPRRAPAGRADRHAGPALHRHAHRRGGDRQAARPGRARLRALRGRGGRRGLAPGAGGAARLACRRVALARARGAERPQHRHRDRQSRPRMGLSPLPGAADGGGLRPLPGRSSRATRSRRATWWRTATSRPTASRIRASCSTGQGWRRTASGCGRAALPAAAGARPPDGRGCAALLGAIGYRTDLPLPTLLAAFQRRWRPERVDGALDAGTLARLAAVAALPWATHRQAIDAKGAARRIAPPRQAAGRPLAPGCSAGAGGKSGLHRNYGAG